jgi:hypothetical protein
MSRFIVCLAAMAALACSCGGAVIPGLSQGQAETAAKATAQTMSSTRVSFVSATSGSFGSFEPHAGTVVSDPNRMVWAVVFRGTFQGSCGPAGPSPHSCPPPNTTVRVVIDYASGAFIMAATPAGAA